MSITIAFCVGVVWFVAWAGVLHWRRERLYASPATLRLDVRRFGRREIHRTTPLKLWRVLARLADWCRYQSACCWCSPRRRYGGNPLARTIRDGVCPACARKLITHENP